MLIITRIYFIKPENKKTGRLISFTEKIRKITKFPIGKLQRDSIEKNEDFKRRIW